MAQPWKLLGIYYLWYNLHGDALSQFFKGSSKAVAPYSTEQSYQTDTC